MPLVSILIPVFNREDFIGNCIQSALDQTIEDLEVVVVDNASTDRTWDVSQEYAAKDSRVRIFRNERNIGPVKNWKRCIDEASGLYGKILFSDDRMHPTCLERCIPFLVDPDVGLVFSSVVSGSSPWKGQIFYRWRRHSGSYSSTEFIEALLLADDVPVSPCAALFRMEDLRKNLVLNIPSPSQHNFCAHGAGHD